MVVMLISVIFQPWKWEKIIIHCSFSYFVVVVVVSHLVWEHSLKWPRNVGILNTSGFLHIFKKKTWLLLETFLLDELDPCILNKRMIVVGITIFVLHWYYQVLSNYLCVLFTHYNHLTKDTNHVSYSANIKSVSVFIITIEVSYCTILTDVVSAIMIQYNVTGIKHDSECVYMFPLASFTNMV